MYLIFRDWNIDNPEKREMYLKKAIHYIKTRKICIYAFICL